MSSTQQNVPYFKVWVTTLVCLHTWSWQNNFLLTYPQIFISYLHVKVSEIEDWSLHLKLFRKTIQFFVTELLKKSAPSRIVMVSSLLHKFAKFDIDNLNFEKWFDINQVYSCSKLANVLTANVLARKLKGTGKPFASNFKIFCNLTVTGKFILLCILVFISS